MVTVSVLTQIMNWDWEKNRPSVMPDTMEAATQQGWVSGSAFPTSLCCLIKWLNTQRPLQQSTRHP